jgi:hypothetical protein
VETSGIVHLSLRLDLAVQVPLSGAGGVEGRMGDVPAFVAPLPGILERSASWWRCRSGSLTASLVPCRPTQSSR